MSKMRGFHIVASDGEIGHVEEFLVDPDSWKVRYLVVDTSNWIDGKAVLIAPSVAGVIDIDSPDEEIRVKMTRAEIARSPFIETVDVELSETLPSVAWVAAAGH